MLVYFEIEESLDRIARNRFSLTSLSESRVLFKKRHLVKKDLQYCEQLGSSCDG